MWVASTHSRAGLIIRKTWMGFYGFCMVRKVLGLMEMGSLWGHTRWVARWIFGDEVARSLHVLPVLRSYIPVPMRYTVGIAAPVTVTLHEATDGNGRLRWTTTAIASRRMSTGSHSGLAAAASSDASLSEFRFDTIFTLHRYRSMSKHRTTKEKDVSEVTYFAQLLRTHWRRTVTEFMKLDLNSSSIVAILIQQSDSVLALLEFSLHRKNNFICQLIFPVVSKLVSNSMDLGVQ